MQRTALRAAADAEEWAGTDKEEDIEKKLSPPIADVAARSEVGGARRVLVNALQELRDFGYDDHEMVAALQSASAGSIRPARARRWDLIADKSVVCSIELNRSGAIKGIYLERRLWANLRPILKQDSRSSRSQIARTILLCRRKIRGFARVEGWVQIRPPVCAIEDRTGLDFLDSVPGGPPSPMVIEVEFRDSTLALLQDYCRFRAVQEARWLLAAFLDVPLFFAQAPYAFTLDDGRVSVVRCGLLSGLEDAPTDRFSDVTGIPELAPVDHSEYFSQLGLGSQEFRVPNLGELRAKYESLGVNDRKRFLRACAWLADASDPNLGRSQRVVALVSALEPLLEKPPKCEKCKNHVGIAMEFWRFLDRYVQPSAEIRKVFESVYSTRSRLVHGGWHYDVDEPLFGVPRGSETTDIAAWVAAKRGIVMWLLSR